MAYDTIVLKKVIAGANLVQAADTVLYTLILPTTAKKFTLQRIFQRASVVMGGTTLAQIKVYKTGLVATGSGTGSAVLLKTCTAFGLTSAVGTGIEDEVVSIATCTNIFNPGDTLEIKVAVTATTTGSADIELQLGMQL